MPSKPRLGQNFLRDQSAIRRIVAALGDISRSTVVEIGPGQGAITGLLASQAARVLAIELDRDLAALLRTAARSPEDPHLTSARDHCRARFARKLSPDRESMTR